jgi:type 1 glutamine amidotransferase
MKKLLLITGILIGSYMGNLVVQDTNKIPVLIVDGFGNHDWKQTTKVTKWILEETGMFLVDVSTIPTDSVQRLAWRADFDKYAVVIQSSNNIWDPKLKWSPEAEKDLEDYVENGGGLFILHSANNAFSHWPAYNQMIGMGWRNKSYGYSLEISKDGKIIRHAPGEGEDTGHGDRFDALIQIINRHPINRDYPDQWKTANTEVYYFPRGPAENLTVLSYAYDSTGTQRNWPMEWVVNYGNGRVYNSSMGHLWKDEVYPLAFRCIGFQTTIIRVTEWLATGETTYPLPGNFPSKDNISLRNEGAFLNQENNIPFQ